jgi:hypothetical protein
MITSPSPNVPNVIDGEFTVVPPPERTKFIHIRFHFDELKHAKNPEGISNRGGATLAYRRSRDRTSFSYAFCLGCLDDNFSRYNGRSIAQGRLESGDGWEISTDIHSPDSRFIEVALDKLNQKAMNVWMRQWGVDTVSKLKKGFY